MSTFAVALRDKSVSEVTTKSLLSAAGDAQTIQVCYHQIHNNKTIRKTDLRRAAKLNTTTKSNTKEVCEGEHSSVEAHRR